MAPDKPMETKHTAIQSLIEDIKIGTLSDHINGVEYFSKDIILEFLERAKQMEKEQIMKAAIQCHFEGTRQGNKTSLEYIQYGEQYYNQTYGN